jgi:HlyD family secretion protein
MQAKWVYSTILLLSAGLAVSGWWLGYGQSRQFVLAEQVQVSQVRSGNFVQRIDGYGSLQSLSQRLITASENAVVDEILLKPGAVVAADSVILRLKNPQLEQKLQTASTTHQNALTARRKQELEQQREMLEQDSQLADVEAEAQLAALQLEAEAPLAKTGIVSAIEFKRSNVRARQLKQRVLLVRQRLQKLSAVHQQQLQLLDDAAIQAHHELNRVQQQFDNLQVRAGLAGVLQRLPINLGQTVQAGAELALVGSLSPLVAQIRVPQLQANLVQLGAKAEVDSRHGILPGVVNRIDPVVVDGAVQIDIALTGDLPQAVRPMQSIDAVIFGKGQDNVLYLDLPAGASADSKAFVYRMLSSEKAQRVQVSFGKTADRLVEVHSGLTEGDKVIISALALESDVESVYLTQ